MIAGGHDAIPIVRVAVEKPHDRLSTLFCLLFYTLVLIPLPRDRRLRLVRIARSVFQLLDVDAIHGYSADHVDHDLFCTIPRLRAEVVERVSVDLYLHRQSGPLKSTAFAVR